jgi:hypothetical protein
MTNQQYRRQAYSQANWLLRREPQNKSAGVRLPACVLAAIYRAFPLEPGRIRVPFGYARASDGELNAALRKRARKIRRAEQHAGYLEGK